MPTSIQKIFNSHKGHQSGFSLIEILVALLLGALVFLAVPSGDSAQKHRDLQTTIDDIDRSIRFASNEAVLRNTVVRLRFSLDKAPVEYTVEYGPAGNIALPDLPEKKTSLSLAEEKAEKERNAALDRNFTKVEEFEEIKREIHPDVSILGLATSAQKRLFTDNEASIYFYPTGEKDGAIVFFSTNEEFAFLEVEPFLTETNAGFQVLGTDSVAKLEDILQTRVDETYKQWIGK